MSRLSSQNSPGEFSNEKSATQDLLQPLFRPEAQDAQLAALLGATRVAPSSGVWLCAVWALLVFSFIAFLIFVPYWDSSIVVTGLLRPVDGEGKWEAQFLVPTSALTHLKIANAVRIKTLNAPYMQYSGKFIGSANILGQEASNELPQINTRGQNSDRMLVSIVGNNALSKTAATSTVRNIEVSASLIIGRQRILDLLRKTYK